MTYENAVQWIIDNAPFNQFTDYDDFYDNFVDDDPTFSDELKSNPRFNDLLEDRIRKKKPEWFAEPDTEQRELEEFEEITEDNEIDKEELKDLQRDEVSREEPIRDRPTTRDISRQEADIASDIPEQKVDRPTVEKKPKVSLGSKIKSAFRRLLRR